MAVIFFDFDSTVVKKETLDDAIAHALVHHPERDRMMQEIDRVTRLGMEGKLDFKESVSRRLAVTSLSRGLLEERGRAMLSEITEGIPEVFAWLAKKNHFIHIVSGGFAENIAPVAAMLGVSENHQHTNRFLFSDRGEVIGVDETALLWTNEGKAPVLQHMRDHYLAETFVMVGDGMNDYRAFESGAADVFCGFGVNVVRESVKAKAPNFFHSTQDLLAFFQKELQ